MPTIYVRLTYPGQQGYNSTGENYISDNWFNAGLKTDRVQIFRFGHVAVPKNSTINSATLHCAYSVKNQTGTNYTFTKNVYIDGVTPSPWLDSSRNEWTTPSRTWSLFGSSSSFTWNQSGASRQIHSHNVKPHLDALAIHGGWTAAGGPITFLLGYTAVSNPDNIYLHHTRDNWGPILEIDYTPPASDGLDTVVNLQDNCAFDRSTNSTGAFSMEPYGYNTWFGAYTQPTYTIEGSGIPAGNPLAVKALKVVAPGTGTPRTMVHSGVPALKDGQWYNFSAYTYVPSGSPDVGLTVLGNRQGGTENNLKDQWVRINIDFLTAYNHPNWITIQQINGPYSPSSVFWVSNVQLTEGRLMRPYIDGRQTLTGATYGWAGPTGYNGFVRAAPPVTPVVPFQRNKARRKYYAPSWSYSQTNGHAQAAAEIKVRRIP